MPKNRAAFPFPYIAPLLLAVLLSGCAINPAQEEARVLAPVPSAELNRAASLQARGKTREAAALYLALASETKPPARAQLQLKAARAYLDAGQTDQARNTIDAISTSDLTPSQRELLLFNQADLALLGKRPRDAIGFLERMQARALPKDLKIQRLGTLASAQRLAGSPIAAAATLNDLDPLLDQRDERLVNQVSLVSTLSLLNPGELQDLTRKGRGAMKGWADVALLTQQLGADPRTLESRYDQWHRSHQGHPALPGLARAYTQALSGGYASGERVTVMLPRRGRFATAAKAVRAGIEAASRADTAGKRPTLDFVDSTNSGRARALHAKATQNGASYVIGPLEKPAVNDLATGAGLKVPTLALNEASRADKRAANLFQFSLSPENEAVEVANKAAALGLKRALLLYPQGAWGDRLANAFRRQWRNLDGTLAGQASFNPTWRNYDKTLDGLLDGTEADMMFLVATSNMARKIYPRIRVHPRNQGAIAKPLTVISTSHVYSGGFDSARDKTLVGLYFVDIPWMLDVDADGPLSRRRLMGSAFNAANPLARLHAMGIDAYRLTPRLTGLAENPGAYYPGQTGGLSIDSLGRVQRQLKLGRFTDTGPRLADATEEPQTSTSNR